MGQSAYNFKDLCVIFLWGLLAVEVLGRTEIQTGRPRSFIVIIQFIDMVKLLASLLQIAIII